MAKSFAYAAVSDVGLTRKNNQDAMFISEDDGFVIVADGMGGHKGGEVASALAVEAIADRLSGTNLPDSSDEMQILMRLGESLEAANRSVRERANSDEELKGMGTTAVVALFRHRSIYYAHVGDSRLYRLRDNKLKQMTRDHSLVQYLVDKGLYATPAEAIASGVGSNMLTRGLGVEESVEVDVNVEKVDEGDIYLLCSDGLNGMISDHRIQILLSRYRDNFDEMTNHMLTEALDAGGRDNITLIVVEPSL
jgi:serine/threonine protein phosphatase PrpC